MRTVLLAAPLVVLAVSGCTAEGSKSGQQPQPASTTGSAEKPKPPSVGPAEPEEGTVTTSTLDPILNQDAPACEGAGGEIYEINVKQLASVDEIPLCRAKGRVLLIVNGASHCGYTPQYKPLQALYAKYAAQGLSILAFPSDSFNQEDNDEATVSDFCKKENGITFPLFAIAPVVDKGAQPAQPVYKWLARQPDMAAPVAWNFEKFLIGRDGKVITRFLSSVTPSEGGEIDKAIATAVAAK